uniref:Uncharacterized protein n=1 Tax=Arundo donax TaxID=35708 RepID=A0A0A8ZCZ4_ARUDO
MSEQTHTSRQKCNAITLSTTNNFFLILLGIQYMKMRIPKRPRQLDDTHHAP